MSIYAVAPPADRNASTGHLKQLGIDPFIHPPQPSIENRSYPNPNGGPPYAANFFDQNPWEGHNGPCAYGERADKLLWEDMPIDPLITKSHRDWVANRQQWSATSTYLPESIEPTLNWRGLRLPEPVPQSCARGELTEYGPADLNIFVTTQRRKCGNPVLAPQEQAHDFKLPFSAYGF